MQPWQKRVTDTFAAKAARGVAQSATVYTIGRLTDISRPPSRDELIDFLMQEIDRGNIFVRYRVISPDTKSVISEFNNIKDVPETIYDDTSGNDIVIDPLSDIELTFQAAH